MSTPLSTDPICFARDENSDLIVPLRVVRGMEALAVMVRCAIRLWRDEFFLNRDWGMPWLPTTDGVVTERDAILGQPFSHNKIASALRSTVLKIQGTKAIKSLKTSFDGETRNVSIKCVISSQFGDLPEIVVNSTV